MLTETQKALFKTRGLLRPPAILPTENGGIRAHPRRSADC